MVNLRLHLPGIGLVIIIKLKANLSSTGTGLSTGNGLSNDTNETMCQDIKTLGVKD